MEEIMTVDELVVKLVQENGSLPVMILADGELIITTVELDPEAGIMFITIEG